MTDVLLLYLFTRVNVLLVLATLAMVASAMMCFFIPMYRDIEFGERPSAKAIRAPLVGMAIAVSVLLLVPSKSDLAIIIGGKVALDAARSDEAKEIGGLVLDAVKRTLRADE